MKEKGSFGGLHLPVSVSSLSFLLSTSPLLSPSLGLFMPRPFWTSAQTYTQEKMKHSSHQAFCQIKGCKEQVCVCVCAREKEREVGCVNREMSRVLLFSRFSSLFF